MSYRLQRGEPLPEGLKRLTLEQIDRAVKQLTKAPDGKDEAVHDARKRFKKIRAVVRLVRDEIGSDVYKRENICYRDAGRRLSKVRDSAVMVETLDDLTAYFADQLPAKPFADIRQALVEARQATKKRLLGQESVMAEVADTIQAARKRVADWPIQHDDFSALSDGLRRVYKRGRKGLNQAYANPEPENFHDWRKRVKYLWYHTRILRPLWPPLFKKRAAELHNLSDYLGDDHDLIELRRSVLEQPGAFHGKPEMQALLGLIDQRRAEFERLAYHLGRRVYAEKPRRFIKRMASYWQVAHTESGLTLLT